MSIEAIILVVSLLALVLAALTAVIVKTLPQATVLLAMASVMLTIVLYLCGFHLAAVIELSVCAGLVTAILASAIAFLKPTVGSARTGAAGASGSGAAARGGKSTKAGKSAASGKTAGSKASGSKAGAKTGSKSTGVRLDKADDQRIVLYLPLFAIMLLLTVAVIILLPGINIDLLTDSLRSTQDVLWSERALDILGLALLILAGVLGVTALIKRREER